MTIPASGTISLSNFSTEMGQASNYSASLSWIKSKAKVQYNDFNSYRGMVYYQKTNAGNCNNGNCNCQCNCSQCGLTECDCVECGFCGQCTNCIYPHNCVQCVLSAANCVNCDATPLLQTNCNCACTYQCTASQCTQTL